MDIAVVITLFNGAAWIQETLESVQRQTRQPAEIVVVDDGSEDGSPDIARAVPGVRLAGNPAKGVAHARRFGVDTTQAPLVAMLDQDDLWHPDHLEYMHAALLQNPDTCGIASDVCKFTERPAWNVQPEARSWLRDMWATFPFHDIITPSSVVLRRAPLQEHGGWPTEAGTTDDYIAMLRAAARLPLLMVARPTTGYRERPDSQSQKTRSRDPVAHLVRRRTFLEQTLPCRLRYRPQEETDLRERLGILDACAGVLRAVCDEVPERLAENALDFERRVSGRHPMYRSLAIRYFLWFSLPTIGAGGPEVVARRFTLIQRHCPARAPTLGIPLLRALEKRMRP